MYVAPFHQLSDVSTHDTDNNNTPLFTHLPQQSPVIDEDSTQKEKTGLDSEARCTHTTRPRLHQQYLLQTVCSSDIHEQSLQMKLILTMFFTNTTPPLPLLMAVFQVNLDQPGSPLMLLLHLSWKEPWG